MSTPEAPGQMPASSWDIQAPYEAGSPDPIFAGGDDDAGGRDDVAGDSAAAQASAQARYSEHASDATAAGPSQIGDAMTLEPVDSNAHPAAVWGPFTDLQPPSGSFI